VALAVVERWSRVDQEGRPSGELGTERMRVVPSSRYSLIMAPIPPPHIDYP
jgi:hypothetical protein